METEAEYMLDALRVAQLTFISLAKDKDLYPRIKEAWQTVCIAMAKAEAL